MEIVGIIGALMYLYSYAALQFRRDYAKTFEYSALNFTAAALVFISLLEHWNAASAIIQVSWMMISAYGIYRCLKYVLKTEKS